MKDFRKELKDLEGSYTNLDIIDLAQALGLGIKISPDDDWVELTAKYSDIELLFKKKLMENGDIFYILKSSNHIKNAKEISQMSTKGLWGYVKDLLKRLS